MSRTAGFTLKDYKNKTLLEKFEVAEIGSLAGRGPASMVKDLSWRLHQPESTRSLEKERAKQIKLPMRSTTLDEESAKFLKKCLKAIDEGDAQFFNRCADMVKFIDTRMRAIPPSFRSRLLPVMGKNDPRGRRSSLWIEAMKPIHQMGHDILHTLLELARHPNRDAAVTQPELMEALKTLYPRKPKWDEKQVREILRAMDYRHFPIPLADFYDLRHSRRTLIRPGQNLQTSKKKNREVTGAPNRKPSKKQRG